MLYQQATYAPDGFYRWLASMGMDRKGNIGMGYSFGGTSALQLAFQHPALVRRLVLVSTPYAQNGFFAEMLPPQAALSAAMADAKTSLREAVSWTHSHSPTVRTGLCTG